MTPLVLTVDERSCIQRALIMRRDMLQSELLFTEVLTQNSSSAQQASEAARILRVEVDLISQCMRALWVVHTNGTDKDLKEVT